MAENETGQERTEEATGKRREEAREKGQIPRSRELNTVLMLLASGAGIWMVGDNIVDGMTEVLRDNLAISRADIFNPSSMTIFFMRSLKIALDSVLPLLVILLIVAIVAPMLLGGWSLSFEPMKPDLKKLDPIKGTIRLFSAKSLMELVKALIKFLLVGAVGYFLLIAYLPRFIELGNMELEAGLAYVGNELLWMFILLSFVLVLVVLADVPFQMWDHARKQKMTRQEVKDEHKQTEGSPEMRSKVRQTQRELAQRRMMQEVPKADVVITNPTHFAVALRYDQDTMSAPIVVALGADEVAGHIRRIALANDVPILSVPPLARALFYNCKLESEIPPGLYLAVAQVLAYIFQLNNYQRDGATVPAFNANVDIPDDLRKE